MPEVFVDKLAEFAEGDRRIRVALPPVANAPAVSVAMPAPTPVTATAIAAELPAVWKPEPTGR
jgi:hypothetical protein